MTETQPDRWSRLAQWFDNRIGLTYPLLRPAPRYSINPLYWLGALTVVAFIIQGLSGMIMMLYYVPSPSDAFQTTQYIFQTVYFGRFLETVHLYTAYAMIMLAFMHMMRGYFVSVQKKPREMMWVVGMVMGFVTLGFGFTGYLLPWTVVSKSATDVGIGMISALPTVVSSAIMFLIVGAGGDATELLRFYDLHVVVLPAVLLVLLTLKMYMLEVHGIAEPQSGLPLEARKNRGIPIFPDVTFYLLGLAAMFGSAMLLISALFPVTLSPEYSPQLAAQFSPQPDWYFLWIYQILKISAFEGAGLPIALTLITLVFVLLLLLPFVDRGTTRRMRDRPVYVTVGLIFIAELFVLAYWGLESPGQVIATGEATLVLGGTAIVVGIASWLAYRLLSGKHITQPAQNTTGAFRTATGFVSLVAVGSLGIGWSFNSLVRVIVVGASPFNVLQLGFSLGLLAATIVSTLLFLYRLELAEGSLRRRFRTFEIGWAADETR